MPAKLPESVRANVVSLWLQAFNLDEIVKMAGVSPGTVRNIIAEARSGRNSRYTDNSDWLDDMRWVSQTLKRQNRSLKEAVIGLAALDALDQIGIEPSDLPRVVQLFKRLSRPGFPMREFAAVALRVGELEVKAKVDFPELEARVGSLRSNVSELETKKADLSASVGNLTAVEEKGRDQLKQLGLTIEEELKANNVTREQLTGYVRTREALSAKGIQIEKVGLLETVVTQLEKLDWDANVVVRHIEDIRDLEGQLRQKKDESSKVKEEVDSATTKLQGLAREKAIAESDIGLARLEKTNILEKVAETKEEFEKKHLQIEFSEAFKGLLREGRVGKERLLHFARQIQTIANAQGEVGKLPLDYNSLRKETIAILQVVLDNELVPRDVVERGNQALRDQIAELQEERWTKTKTDLANLKKQREEFFIQKREFEEASLGKIMVLAMDMIAHGSIHVVKCDNCKAIIVSNRGPSIRHANRSGCPWCIIGSSRPYSIKSLETRVKQVSA